MECTGRKTGRQGTWMDRRMDKQVMACVDGGQGHMDGQMRCTDRQTALGWADRIHQETEGANV